MDTTLLDTGLRPRLHDRRRGRADQPGLIRRTLAEGRVVGLVSGLGVATADATYGAIAAFGLTAITDLLVDCGAASASSAACSCSGSPGGRSRAVPGAPRAGRTVSAGDCRRLPEDARADAHEPDDDPVVRGALRRARRQGGTPPEPTLLTLGVFAGSASWWVVLTTVVGAVRSRLTQTDMRRINIGSGLLIGAFALVALATVVGL